VRTNYGHGKDRTYESRKQHAIRFYEQGRKVWPFKEDGTPLVGYLLDDDKNGFQRNWAGRGQKGIGGGTSWARTAVVDRDGKIVLWIRGGAARFPYRDVWLLLSRLVSKDLDKLLRRDGRLPVTKEGETGGRIIDDFESYTAKPPKVKLFPEQARDPEDVQLHPRWGALNGYVQARIAKGAGREGSHALHVKADVGPETLRLQPGLEVTEERFREGLKKTIPDVGNANHFLVGDETKLLERGGTISFHLRRAPAGTGERTAGTIVRLVTCGGRPQPYPFSARRKDGKWLEISVADSELSVGGEKTGISFSEKSWHRVEIQLTSSRVGKDIKGDIRVGIDGKEFGPFPVTLRKKGYSFPRAGLQFRDANPKSAGFYVDDVEIEFTR
jgi:hypothetical protein